MTTTSPEQNAPATEQEVGYVVVDAAKAGDRSGWMTPRMRATAAQAEEDRDFWRDSGRAGTDMDLRVAKLVLLDEPKEAPLIA